MSRSLNFEPSKYNWYQMWEEVHLLMFLSNFTSIHVLCDVIIILQHDCSCFLQMWLIQRAKYAAVLAFSNQLIPSSIFIY